MLTLVQEELHTSPMTGLYFWDLPRVSQFWFRYFDSIYIWLSTSICIVLIPVADPGKGPGVPAPSSLFVDRTEVRRAEKNFFWDPPSCMPLYRGVVSPVCLWEIVAWERSSVFNWVCVWRHLFFKVEVEMFPSERFFFKIWILYIAH